MEYDKLTKAELIEKLKEQKHLAQAVEAKDKEVAKVKEEFLKTREELERQLRSLNEQLVKSITLEKHQEILKQELATAEETVKVANMVLQSHNNAMNLVNSAMAVINQNEALLSEKIK